MTPEELVRSEWDRGLLQEDRLPLPLQQAVARHCANLVDLVAALQSAGQEPGVIRLMVAELLRSYEADLVEVLEVRQ